MAVSLPPPLTPQLGNVEELRTRSSGAIVLSYQDFRLHVFGTDKLAEARLQTAIANADNLSNAVRAIGAAYYGAGYPAAQLVYALSGQDLYIMVVLGQVTTAAGPEYLTQYFEGMDASGPLRDSMLEPRRTLASLHADRAGDNATPLFVLQRDGNYQIDFRPDQNGPKVWSVRGEISNPGNRFVGRHFGDLDGSYSTRWGDQFRLLGRRSLDFLNENSENVDYTEGNLAWNRVTPYGVFGIALSNSVYHVVIDDVQTPQGPAPLPVRGEMTYGELDWFGLVAASFNSRWTLQARLGRTDKTVDPESGTFGRMQHELYNWAELGTQFSYVQNVGQQRLVWETGVSVGKGLTSGDTLPSQAVPSVSLSYVVIKPTARVSLLTSNQYTISLEGSGQVTDDNLPEQQQWVLGGPTSMAAWLPGIVVGDTGATVRASVEPKAMQVWKFKVLPKAFVEWGFGKFENTRDLSTLEPSRPEIADAGIDLTLSAFEWLEVGLTYADGFYDRDIDESELDASRGRVFFRLAGKF